MEDTEYEKDAKLIKFRLDAHDKKLDKIVSALDSQNDYIIKQSAIAEAEARQAGRNGGLKAGGIISVVVAIAAKLADTVYYGWHFDK